MKILILRFSSIGDIVLTTPVIRCLKQQVKDVAVHYLTRRPFQPVLQANPYIDRLMAFDHSTKEILHVLKEQQYDVVIDLHNNIRTARVKQQLKAESHVVNKLNIRKWLLVNFKLDVMPDRHIVDRYMDTVQHLGVRNDRKGLDYFIPEEEEVSLASLPPQFANGYVAIVAGAKHFTKSLPTDKLIRICEGTVMPVILLGGPDEKEKADAIVSALGEKACNACGQYSINQSASLVRQAAKVVAHDTGLMHIAAAFNKDMVSVWGNTVPEFGMYPYLPEQQPGKSLIVQHEHLSCRPCTKLGYRECPRKHFKCMNEIDVDKIIRFVNQ